MLLKNYFVNSNNNKILLFYLTDSAVLYFGQFRDGEARSLQIHAVEQ